jgi:hypothetical protein
LKKKRSEAGKHAGAAGAVISGWTSTRVFAYLLVTQAAALREGRKSGGGIWEENKE